MCVHAWATQPHTDPLTHTKWSGCQLTKNKITSQLIEIIGFCLKMFDLWRLLHPHWLIWNTQLSAHPASGDSHLQLKFEYLQTTSSAMMNKTHKQSSWNTIALVYFHFIRSNTSQNGHSTYGNWNKYIWYGIGLRSLYQFLQITNEPIFIGLGLGQCEHSVRLPHGTSLVYMRGKVEILTKYI